MKNNYEITKFFKTHFMNESYAYVITINSKRRVMIFFTRDFKEPVFKGTIYNIFEELDQKELMEYTKGLYKDLQRRKWIKEECREIRFEWEILGK